MSFVVLNINRRYRSDTDNPKTGNAHADAVVNASEGPATICLQVKEFPLLVQTSKHYQRRSSSGPEHGDERSFHVPTDALSVTVVVVRWLFLSECVVEHPRGAFMIVVARSFDW